MTKDRAIDVLYVYASVNGSGRCTQDEFEEAKKMAIEALSNSEIPNNSDCISRQVAIDALRGMQTYKLFAGDDLLLIDQAEAQTELMMLPSAQPELRWIPVSEKLPEIKEHHTSEPCIVYCDNGAYAFAELEENIFGQVGWDCERDDDYHEAVGTVIAWMPLPEPYKGEES